MLFVLAGAKRIYTFDVRPWLNERLFRAGLSHAAAMGRCLESWPGLDLATIDEGVSIAQTASEQPTFSGALHVLGIQYSVTDSMLRPNIRTNSVDLFYSWSVLQRLRSSDLVSLLEESRRFLADDGISFHEVECKDFHSITKPRIAELAYLTVPTWLWNLATSTYLNYQNRLRLPESIEAFNQAGFETKIVWSALTNANVQFVSERPLIRKRYSNMGPPEIAVSRF